MNKQSTFLSIIIPAKNEAIGLQSLLPQITSLYPDAEIIVVNDGSTDNTKNICEKHKVKVISHPYSMGNGAAIKTGARSAKGDVFLFMDADLQHNPEDIERLINKFKEGYEMVVGARGASSQASLARLTANSIYNKVASLMTGHKILDLTSGFRIVRARHFRKFIYLLPNGFSYPTTITMAFFRSGLPVTYLPISAGKRTGKSNISLVKDGLRFFIIIIKIGALFSPMRFFLPISSVLFLVGFLYYLYSFINIGRFTNMSALLFTSSLLVFLIGILSEQISALHYKGADEDARRTKRGE